MSKEKQYGLILPKSKAGQVKPKVASVFNDSSSDDDETKAVVSGGTDWMKKKLSTKNARSGATGMGTKSKPRTEAELKKAQELDPTIFLYDENVELDKAAKEKEVAAKKEVDRKPKYIANLLKHAKIREKENERRIERQVQKERDAEGDEFSEKEKFVTSAYRKKMEEMQKLDEEEKKRDAIENALDVTKQKDMSGFYRHLYRQTMGEEKGQKEEVKTEIKEEPLDDQDEQGQKDIEETDVQLSKKTKPSQRSYRRRDSEPADEESASQDDSSSASSADEEDITDAQMVKETEEKRIEKAQQRREELRKQKEKREKRKRRIEKGLDTSSDEEEDNVNQKSDGDDNTSKSDSKTLKEDKEILIEKPKKAKKDIWKKITIGDVYDAALQRYLIRKAERGSLSPPWIVV